MAAVATGLGTDAMLKAALVWTPTLLWTIAGAALLALALTGLARHKAAP
jgi:hypothetical protein